MARDAKKELRMAARREIGNRVVKAAEPKAEKVPIAPYSVAHACFTCRRSFKRPPELDDTLRVCPGCEGPLYEMGRSFKAPRRTDIRQWKKVQMLFAHGFRFFSYRSYDCPPLPSSLREVEHFLRENPQHPFKTGAPNWDLLPKERGQ